MKNLVISLIKFYQLLISPWFGNCCRFHPTCSNYAVDCFNNFNTIKALFLISKRVLKCQPWCQGGIDPIPNHQQDTVSCLGKSDGR